MLFLGQIQRLKDGNQINFPPLLNYSNEIIVALEKRNIIFVPVSSSRAKWISGHRLITSQISDTDHLIMHIGMEHDKSNKSHLLSAVSHKTPLPYLTLVTSRYFG